MDRKHLRAFAHELMTEHGLIWDGWSLRIGNARRQFGSCNYSDRIITISGVLAAINPDEDVEDTILHEIAHALAGFTAGHGADWQRQCRLIGAKPERCGNYVLPPKRFVGTCPACGHESRRERRTQVACGRCCKEHNGGKFHMDFLLSWQRAEQVAA